MSLKILFVIEKNCWMDTRIAQTLELMGHIVFRFYFGEYLCEFYGRKRRPEQIQKNIELVNTARALCDSVGLDLIFCFVYDDFLLPKYAKILSNLNVRMVNYNVDMPFQWYRQIRTAHYFDLILCGQPDNMKHIARYAKKIFYFPMAAQLSQPSCLSNSLEKIYDVSFLGTALPYRRRVLSALIKKSVSLSIFGKYWDSFQPSICNRRWEKTRSDIIHYAWPRLQAEGINSMLKNFFSRFSPSDKKNIDVVIPAEIIKGELTDQELSVVFCRSKINIGLTRYEIDDLNQVGRCQMKLRDFEVPMSGGFYLVEKSPGYDQAFIDGKEVAMWQTFPELLEKIHYYLEHDHEREKIAAAGQKRALQEHTWEIRFNKLFLELGLKKQIV